MCVSVSKNLCALPQMQNRDHSAEVVKYAAALGVLVWGSATSPAGLRGPGDSPSGWSPRKPAGITQETGRTWGQLRLGTWALFLHVAAAGLFTCFFFLTAAKPYCRGQRPGPFADGWRAVICWCCSGWSPWVSLCLVISHNSSARTWLAQEELFSFPGPNSVLLLMKMNQTYRCGFAFYPSPST